MACYLKPSLTNTMFLSQDKSHRQHDSDGNPSLSGLFLVLMQPKTDDLRADSKSPIRAYVASAKLEHIGNFMGGSMQIGKNIVPLSGTYGADGLTRSVDPKIYNAPGTVAVPAELRDLWNKGGGWNSGGDEAPVFYEWARRVFPKCAKLPERFRNYTCSEEVGGVKTSRKAVIKDFLDGITSNQAVGADLDPTGATNAPAVAGPALAMSV